MIFKDSPNGPWLARALPSGDIELNPDVPDALARLQASQPTLFPALKRGLDAVAELAAVRSTATQTDAERAVLDLSEFRKRYRVAVRVIRFLIANYGIKEEDAIVADLRKQFGDRVADLIFREVV